MPRMIVLTSGCIGVAAAPINPPTRAEIALVVEVADSSRAYDRQVKFPLYAAGIAETWPVDITARRIERHAEPGRRATGQLCPPGAATPWC